MSEPNEDNHQEDARQLDLFMQELIYNFKRFKIMAGALELYRLTGNYEQLKRDWAEHVPDPWELRKVD